MVTILKKNYFVFILFLFFINTSFSMTTESLYGVEFNCQNNEDSSSLISDLNKEFKLYHLENKINIVKKNQNVVFYIDSQTKSTTSIKNDFKILNEKIYLPTLKKYLSIVSKKEILISLSYKGRLTHIPSCNIKDLQEHIGIRQNIVLWASYLNWQWPDGEKASWNNHFWNSGTPLDLSHTYEALYDAFLHQDKYGIGCYTATKMVYVFAILDYYKRVSPNKTKFNLILQKLTQDKDPLVSVEPGIMWNFEDTFNPDTDRNEGKILDIYQNVFSTSLVPGDWIYILNTDKNTYQKTGYEGSNAIYLGNNKFDDYYNDNHHSYTFEQKLDEVYQWRNKVFSRSRDFKKIEKLTPEKLQSLKNSPEENGLLMKTRTVPKFF